jgi:xanthosine utilization system XapX-like protein
VNTKSVSRISGVLYIATVLAFLVSNLFLKEPLVDAGDVPGTLERVADNALQYQLAVALDFLAMVAVMALVFSLFTIPRPHGPYLALLALGWRIGEVVLQAGAKVPDYLLLTLSQSAASPAGAGMAELETLGQMVIAGSTRAVWLSFVFLSVGSIFNNYLFFKGAERSRLPWRSLAWPAQPCTRWAQLRR